MPKIPNIKTLTTKAAAELVGVDPGHYRRLASREGVVPLLTEGKSRAHHWSEKDVKKIAKSRTTASK